LKKYLILIFSLLLLSTTVWAATWLDPNLKWQTLETRHFSIHFHDGEEAIARKMANIVEDVHKRIVPVMQHQPDIKTNVVLLDSADYGNGYTTVVPDPRITLFLTDWSSNLTPSKFDDWLYFVFLHEYAHVLHLDITSQSLIPVRLIFGRVIYPNGVMPTFWIEGLATYMETKYTQWGRGVDPRWIMMMRMDVLEDNLKSLDQASVSTVQWPLGHLRYLYGVQFIQYLAETYGEDKVRQFNFIYGDFLYTPIGVDGAFYLVYGKFLNQLWSEWLAELEVKYSAQQYSLGKLTKPMLLTSTGYYNLKPKWSKDGSAIFYNQMNADDYPSIRWYDLITQQDRWLDDSSRTSYSNSLALTPDGHKLLFTKTATYRNYYAYKDLFWHDLRTGQDQRLTKGARVAEADISPDGQTIVYVKNSLGTNSLMLMDIKGENHRRLCSGEADTQYFSPHWSPDGQTIAVAIWRPGGQQKIYFVDPQDGSQRRLTQTDDLTAEANPCFSPDGQYLYYDSDRTGIVNLYAYQLATHTIFQLTNVIGGAMMPDVSPDGKKLAYVSYSSRGYDLALLDLDLTKAIEVKEPAANRYDLPRLNNSQISSVEVRLHDYDPLPTLIPKFWLPLGYSNENGAQTYCYTAGADILEKHYYSLHLGYDSRAGRPQYYFTYANNQYLPQFLLQLSEDAIPYSWYGTNLWMKEQDQLAALSYIQNAVVKEWDQQTWSFGYEQFNLTNISSLTAYPTVPSMGNIRGLFAGWRYVNTNSYPKSICPEDGVDLSAQVNWNLPDLGSDYRYTTYNGTAALYFDTYFKHNILVPTLNGFYSHGDQLEQSNFTWKYLPLRGYPSNILFGNKGLLLSTEYYFPIIYAEAGILKAYTFLDRVWGTVFFDVGGATLKKVTDLNFKRSYGASLNMDLIMLWSYGINLQIIFEKGIDTGGTQGVYFKIGI
jgi:Tol biopolymer transport system component